MNDLDPKDFAGDVVLIEKAFNMASITPNQIINLIGSKFGLKPSNNPYMDEYYLNGTPLEQVWSNNGRIDYENSVLESLREEIMVEAEEYEQPIEEENDEFGEDGLGRHGSGKSGTTFKQKLKNIFNS